MKKYIYPLAITAAMLATACSDDVVNDVDQPVPDSQKEKIAFTMSDESGNVETRSYTRAGFTSSTEIIARFVSVENVATSSRTFFTRTIMTAAAGGTGTDDVSNVTYSSVANDTRYWDDAFGRNAQLSVYAVAVPGQTKVKNGGNTDNDVLETHLDFSGTDQSKNWKSGDENNKITWVVSTDQSTQASSIDLEDLCFSNNIKDGGTGGRYPQGDQTATRADGQMIFTLNNSSIPEGPGKFDKGHMIFKHALTRIVVNLKEGAGFDQNLTSESPDFKFTNESNITFKNMNVKGSLDIKAGSWTIATTDGTKDITKSSKQSATKSGFNGTFMVQVLPNYTLTKGSTSNVMEFEIDNNKYYVTQAQVLKALDGKDGITQSGSDETSWTSSYSLKPGYKYELDITVDKSAINTITASVVGWNEVTGSYTINNAPIEFSVKNNESDFCGSFNLYRLKEVSTVFDPYSVSSYTFGSTWTTNWNVDAQTDMLKSGETGLARKSSDTSSEDYNKWSTSWYFESNKTYYHFRTTSQDIDKSKITTDSDNGDYFTIQTGTDTHWGAPYKTEGSLKYNTTNGWSSEISKAIGASSGQLNLIEHHMMSQVQVIVETKNDDSKVDLGDGSTEAKKCKVKLINFYDKAKVHMGTGLVNGQSEIKAQSAAQAFTAPQTYLGTKEGFTTTQAYSCYFVPQTLCRNTTTDATDTDFVGLVIETPDNNEYYVVKKLNTITATTVSNTTISNQEKDQSIQTWYPGHKYIYTITISKKGIETITCSVVDWVTVTGSIGNITLED